MNKSFNSISLILTLMDTGETVRVDDSVLFWTAKVTGHTAWWFMLWGKLRMHENQSSLRCCKISRVTLLMGLDVSSQSLNLMAVNYLLRCCNCFTHLFHVNTRSLITVSTRYWIWNVLIVFPEESIFSLACPKAPESLDGFHQRTRRGTIQSKWTAETYSWAPLMQINNS